MGEIILETNIPREPEFLYYCSTNEEGNLVIGKAKLQRGRRKKNVEQ